MMDPIAFTGVKFLLSALALLPLALRTPGPVPGGGGVPAKLFWFKAGLWAGVLLALMTVLQYEGMVWTTSGKSAFISSLYVVFVPLLALFSRRYPGVLFWTALAVSLCGLWLVAGLKPGARRPKASTSGTR